MSYYFFSDVHLGIGTREEDRERERKLLSFLQHVEEEAGRGSVQGLYIVGDLFDSWFEFNSVIPRRHIRTLGKIADIADRIPVEYLMGNHDFGHRTFFETELGVKLHREDIEPVLLGKRFFIAHGDGKAKNDKGYLILRKLLRSKLAQAFYWTIHPDLGIPFAESLSKGSRVYTDQRVALQKQDGLLSFAREQVNEKGFDYVIMGHRHIPLIERFEKGTYVNLGDWITSYTYGVFDETGFEIRRWNRKETSLK